MSHPAVSSLSRPSVSAALEILHPITWFAPMWAFGCGVVSSGLGLSGHWPLILAGVVLAGPMVCGTSQAINDWFDRHVDAINEPNRPIPSGRLPGFWGFYIACILTLLSLALASTLGPWGFAAGVFGLALAWAYSAPPFRLKQNGWLGNAAVGICYEGVPWFTGAAVMTGALPDPRIILAALLYSIGSHGIMTLNDFKSEDGDRKMGIRSLPVQLGVNRAAWLACITMGGVQVIMIGALLVWGSRWPALGVAALLGVQLVLMRRLLRDPHANAIWYNATGTTLYVLGMLVTAFALRYGAGGGA